MCTNHITDSLANWIPSRLGASYRLGCTSPQYLTKRSIGRCPQFNQADTGEERYRGTYQGRNSDPLTDSSIVVELQ